MLINIEHESAFPNLGDPIVIDIEGGQSVFHDADGEEVLGLILPDEDPRVDFNDFVVFTQAFGYSAADLEFDFRADLNVDGTIDFADFLILTNHFGRVAVDAPSSVSTKPGVGSPTPTSTGQSALSKGISLQVDGKESDENRLVLSVTMYGACDLQGWGFTLTHDVEGFEFLGARLPTTNLLEKNGSAAPLLMVKSLGKGQTLLASASAGESVSGDGKVVEAVFGIRGIPDRGTFRVEEGVVFDSYRKQSGLLAVEKEVYVTGPSHSTLLGSIRHMFESTQLP